MGRNGEEWGGVGRNGEHLDLFQIIGDLMFKHQKKKIRVYTQVDISIFFSILNH